ncbi:hypothetical protein H310_04268 [Aphanomyces invadans]|uniref:Uncharacterized protein n=1 Tax=Aphanomyces invadans TaxID=157072 RepID=A0A024UFZ4_9STRA|nr:hypothetical protein H310_04268 [Aphanomyces invadans]ETW05316.1 hypothetical protein H310_04268 [Aphanomyces invadans]|eukprot:XP_008866754.1 hypothetical protein H310_04268 [Aphanomyces invadans]
MGPKAKKKEPEPEDNGVTRAMVVASYTKMCRAIGVPVNAHVTEMIKGKGEEADEKLAQVVVDEEFGNLGNGGIRAMTCAFLGTVPHNNTGPYQHLANVRVWNNAIGDEGASAISTLLSEGSALVNVLYVELMDCDIGPEGCAMLADALKPERKSPLQTLKLNCNNKIGNDGVYALCQGLFANHTIKQLHLDFCNVSSDGGVVLAQLLCMAKSALETLSLQGNMLGDAGLLNISKGLKRSQSLVKLNVSDNGIRKDVDALTTFRDAILRCKTLTTIKFAFNFIDAEGADILLPALSSAEGSRVTVFEVDASLPPDVFQKLNRGEKADGKKKKGGKKGKKKK